MTATSSNRVRMHSIGYGRISILAQNLEVQIQTFEKENCDDIYSEKFTGTKKNALN